MTETDEKKIASEIRTGNPTKTELMLLKMMESLGAEVRKLKVDVRDHIMDN